MMPCARLVVGATVLKLSRSQRDHELRKEKAAHTALLVSTVGKGVLASAWSKMVNDGGRA